VLPSSAYAQDVPPLKPGTRLRVQVGPPTSDPRSTVGTYVGLSGDSLLLQPIGQSTPSRILLTSVRRVEVSQGQRGFGWKKGALVGFAAGALGGLAVLGQGSGCYEAECVGVLVLAGGLVVAGSIIGGLLARRREAWEEVSGDRLRLLLSPRADGRVLIGWSILPNPF
jgi:hypothetical protein